MGTRLGYLEELQHRQAPSSQTHVGQGVMTLYEATIICSLQWLLLIGGSCDYKHGSLHQLSVSMPLATACQLCRSHWTARTAIGGLTV